MTVQDMVSGPTVATDDVDSNHAPILHRSHRPQELTEPSERWRTSVGVTVVHLAIFPVQERRPIIHEPPTVIEQVGTHIDRYCLFPAPSECPSARPGRLLTARGR